MKKCNEEKGNGKKGILWVTIIFVLFAIVAFFGGIVIGYFTGDTSTTEKSDLITVVIGLFVLCLGNFLHIIIHEAGHLLFGIVTGYRFSSFRIGGIMLARINGKLCLKRHKVTGTGGQCLMIPPELKDGKIPFMLYNLGGILLDFTVSLIVLVVLMVINPVMNFVAYAVLVFGIGGIISSVFNGIPMYNRLIFNDGGNILLLKKSQKAMQSFWYQLKIYSELSEGVRLKDMPEEWFPIPEGEDIKNSMTCATGVFACNRLLDEKKFIEARELIDKLLDENAETLNIHRNQLLCDKIYLDLVSGSRTDLIRELSDKPFIRFMKQMKDSPSVMRTNYAAALLYYKNEGEAEKIKKKFDKREKTYAFAADMQSERELIEIAEQKV